MAYCGPKGIPLSTFLSWPVDDQQAALVWQAEESLKCPNCGTADWQWEQDPDFAEPETRICIGCQMLDIERENNDKGKRAPGQQIRLKRTGGQDGED
jgi:hypothetical protein